VLKHFYLKNIFIKNHSDCESLRTFDFYYEFRDSYQILVSHRVQFVQLLNQGVITKEINFISGYDQASRLSYSPKQFLLLHVVRAHGLNADFDCNY
jgi:hypothetical protein